jgi:hypothetical protein
MRKILLLMLVAICISTITFGQVATDGDYRTIGDGNWNTLANWQTRLSGSWVAATSLPVSTNNVYIQSNDNIIVAAAAACANLNIRTSGTVTINNTFSLEVNGKIRSYTGSEVNSTGADGAFYSGQTNSTSPANDNVGGPGTLRFVGSTRSITVSGEWGTSGLTGDAVIEFALTAGQTGTLNTGFKAETIIITSGNIDMQGNRLAPDGGATNQGTLTINGGNLISSQTGLTSGSQVLSRTGTSRCNTFTLSSGGILTLNGGTPSIDATTITLDGTVVYNASATQIFLQRSSQDASASNIPTYQHVTLAGTSAKTLSQNTTVNGTLSVQGSPTATSLGLGAFTLAYGAVATLEYAASVAQNTASTEFPSSAGPFNLKINNALGVTLHAARSINGNLDMTSGVLTTTGTFLITINDNGTTSGASDASFVNGPVQKIGNDAFDFPVGTTVGANRYHPISIGVPSASTTFEAEYIRAPATFLDPDLNTGIYGVSFCEYWRLDRTGASATADVTLSWNSFSPCGGSYITTLLGLIVAWRDPVDSRWENSLGVSQTATSVSPFTTGTLLRATVSADGFGYFTFGNTNINGSPLPVKLSNIRAYEKQQGVQLDWTAYSEENLSGYQVERSANGQLFTPIGDVAARNTGSETKYGFFDASPIAGINFYRIKNINLDGKSGFSSIVKVNLDKSVKDVTVYPNPVRGGYISLQSSDLSKGNYSVRIFNASGQQVYARRLSHSGGAINQTIQLPSGIRSGMYGIQLDSDGMKVMSKTFMVQ